MAPIAAVTHIRSFPFHKCPLTDEWIKKRWCVCVCARLVVSDCAMPWSVAHQAPLSVEFSRQGYWNSLLLPTPGDLPDPRNQSLTPPAFAGRFSTTAPPGKPHYLIVTPKKNNNKFQQRREGALPLAALLTACLSCRPHAVDTGACAAVAGQ